MLKQCDFKRIQIFQGIYNLRGKYFERFFHKEDRIVLDKPFMLYVICIAMVPFNIYIAFEIQLKGCHRNICRSFLKQNLMK